MGQISVRSPRWVVRVFCFRRFCPGGYWQAPGARIHPQDQLREHSAPSCRVTGAGYDDNFVAVLCAPAPHVFQRRVMRCTACGTKLWPTVSDFKRQASAVCGSDVLLYGHTYYTFEWLITMMFRLVVHPNVHALRRSWLILAGEYIQVLAAGSAAERAQLFLATIPPPPPGAALCGGFRFQFRDGRFPI